MNPEAVTYIVYTFLGVIVVTSLLSWMHLRGGISIVLTKLDGITKALRSMAESVRGLTWAVAEQDKELVEIKKDLQWCNDTLKSMRK